MNHNTPPPPPPGTVVALTCEEGWSILALWWANPFDDIARGHYLRVHGNTGMRVRVAVVVEHHREGDYPWVVCWDYETMDFVRILNLQEITFHPLMTLQVPDQGAMVKQDVNLPKNSS